MPTKSNVQDQIDSAQAAALAEEIAAAASGKIDFGAGKILQSIQDRPDIQQSVTSTADDYVTIYDNWKGLPSTIPLYMLAKKLRQRYPQENTVPQNLRGRPVFSLTQNVKPVVGAYVCWFNPESPHKDEMNEIGYVGLDCSKAHIPTEIEVENHVMHKHTNEYKGITRNRDRKRADGQNAALLELLQALVNKEK